jgi:hypothetical protein
MQEQFELSFEHAQLEIPELGTVRDVGVALERRDDKLLWEAARRCGTLAVFYEQLRAQVGFAAVPIVLNKPRRIRECAALLAMPVLLTAADAALVSTPEIVSRSMGRVILWLEEWFHYKVHIRLFSCLFTYAEICMWSPSATRSRLLRLMDRNQATEAIGPVHFGLPADAPMLAFIIAAAHRPLEWPALPHLDPEGDLKLQARVSGLLQVCGPASTMSPVQVLTPGFLSEAIADGLDAFFGAIANRYGVVKWGVKAHGPDMVVAHLEIPDQPNLTVSVPLRAHQLGLDGIEARLRRLEGLATEGRGLFKSHPH